MIALPLSNCRRWCVTSGYQMLPGMLPLKSLKYNGVTSVTSILLIREKIERKVIDYAQTTTTKTSAGYAPVPTCKKQVTQVTYNQISELRGNAIGNVEVTGSDTSYACDQPIKVSVVPIVNPKTLQAVFASRVPAAGSVCKYLVRGCSRSGRFGHAEYPHDQGLGTVHFFSHSSLKKVPVEFGCSCTNQIGIQ